MTMMTPPRWKRCVGGLTYPPPPFSPSASLYFLLSLLSQVDNEGATKQENMTPLWNAMRHYMNDEEIKK